jgi:hypothetical protein
MGKQCLAATGGAHEKNVSLIKLHISATPMCDSLVVIVDGNRENAFGILLTDDVFI